MAREEGRIVSCAFLIVVEKPMSPAFMCGRTGIVLNVYTRPNRRRRGYARQVMVTLLAGAHELGLSVVELQATDDGHPLSLSVGFSDDQSKYLRMRWLNRYRPSFHSPVAFGDRFPLTTFARSHGSLWMSKRLPV